ncbi:MAG TPA: hypothetical protein VFA60_09315 [Terriglobales bacterium]|nr:hypothetical protein [Terriglobales bacterium]
MISRSPSPTASRVAVPLVGILLLAIAVHGPLLLMQVPASSYDANTHMFFASHYAHHWFDPWNEKWYGGFSQTTYPPLAHQWVALFSFVMGLPLAYMFVQLCVILLIATGMYRYAGIWVEERAASCAAIGSVLLGSLAILVYQSGQLPSTFSAALTLNALPYFYGWTRSGRFSALLKGVLVTMAAAAAHHVTLLFGMVLFAVPVLWLAVIDRERDNASPGGVISRGIAFIGLSALLAGIVLLPYFIQLRENPINQMPIPHGSRDNYLLNPASGLNFWLVPYGALVLAVPFIFFRGSTSRRLRPLFFGWWLTMLIGLGGTTPVARLLLGRAFEVLTFERFTFWSTLMALPIAGLLSAELMDRYGRKAAVTLWVLGVFSASMGVAWTVFRPINSAPFRVDQVIAFLNRDEHSKFRYITLGFGNNFSRVATYADAGSVDGDYNSARLLPELTAYGAGQLNNAKYFGASGMESLRQMLKHANQYGLKYIFVRDRFYEPLLAFAGWRQAETYDNGNVTMWVNDSIQPARKIESGALPPPAWQGLMWGTLPVGVSLLAIIAVFAVPERRRVAGPVAFPGAAQGPAFLREAK